MPRWFARHPIDAGLNLLAVGTAIWVPSLLVWLGAVLMALGSVLRVRAEERLLAGEFGVDYAAYRARTSRFIPGVY